MARIATIPKTDTDQTSNLTNLFLSSLLQQQAAEAGNARLIERMGLQDRITTQRQSQADIQKRQFDAAKMAEDATISAARQDFLFGGIQPNFQDFQQKHPTSIQGMTPEQFTARATSAPDKAVDYLSMLEAYKTRTDPALRAQSEKIIELQKSFDFEKLRNNLGFQEDIRKETLSTGKPPTFDRIALFAAQRGLTDESLKLLDLDARIKERQANILVANEPQLLRMEADLNKEFAQYNIDFEGQSRGPAELRAGIAARGISLDNRFELLGQMKRQRDVKAKELGVDFGTTEHVNPMRRSGRVSIDPTTGKSIVNPPSALDAGSLRKLVAPTEAEDAATLREIKRRTLERRSKGKE